MKKRLTITLDEDLLKKIDASVDGVNIRNRSHAIEHLLDASLLHIAPKKAVLFAGGRKVEVDGRLLYSPMIPINGMPIMAHVLNELKRNGITDVLVTIGKGSDDIVEYFGDGSSFGLKINYIREDAPRGTEGALELVNGLVGREPFFALNSDHIFRLDMADMYLQHASTKAMATIALTTSISESRMGVTRLDGFKITSFSEKPQKGEAKIVNAGIYLFDPAVLGLLTPSAERIMLEQSLFPMLANSGRLFGYVFSTPWYSIDNLDDIKKSKAEMERVAAMIQKESARPRKA